MKNRFTFSMLFSLLLCCNLWAQNATNLWYFGGNAGLDFSSGSPVAVSNSAMNTNEGCITVSDDNSNLLFYSDGVTVYNSAHQIMVNGNGLNGGNSASQSCIAFADPANANQYYIFTVPEGGNTTGFYYNVLDMSMNGGLGQVVMKNQLVQAGSFAEKIHALYTPGGDVWVIAQLNNSNTYVTVLVTNAGVGAPSSQSIGTVHPFFVSGLRFSHDGSKLASCNYQASQIELFDFDYTTGLLSNPATHTFPGNFPAYSIEYSPSGQYMYVGNVDVSPGLIYQFDLNAGNNTAILATAQLVLTVLNNYTGTIQLATDGKIYCPSWSSSFVSVINDPDMGGVACNGVANALSVIGQSYLGLPQWPAGTFGVVIKYDKLCLGDSTEFNIQNAAQTLITDWNFDDPSSGVNNTSSLTNPKHLFTAVGTYNVRLIRVFTNLQSDTTYQPITIDNVVNINLGNDTTICIGQSVVLNAGTSYTNYQWQNGSTNTTYTATGTGMYYVTADNGQCKGTDSIDVTAIQCSGPLAALSSSDTLWCDKTCIDFFDLSQNNPASWTWYFQGASPSTSTDQNPTGICYNNYGSFDVSLVACNSLGCDSVFFNDFVTEFQLPLPPTITYSNDTLYASPAFSYQWYNTNNINVVLNTNNYFVPVVDGNYFVLGFDSNGCATPSATFGFYTGINNYTYNSNDVILTPINGGNYFSLLINSKEKIKQLSLIDVAGKQINLLSYDTDGENNFILDLNNVSKGIYFVKVEFVNHSSIRRLVKL